MKQILKKIGKTIAYMFTRKGFFTKKMVIGTLTLMMLLYVDIRCHIWNGAGLMILILLFVYVIGLYILRYMDLKKEDEKMNKEEPASQNAIQIEPNGEHHALKTEGITPMENIKQQDTFEQPDEDEVKDDE